MEIDEIRIQTPDGTVLKSIEEWIELSTREKVDYLRNGQVEFLSDGEPAPMKDALKILRAGT